MKTAYQASYAVNQSLSNSADFTGTSLSLNQQFGYSIQATWTGTPNGTFKLQASNDNVNWSDLPNTVAAGGAAGSTIWNVTDVFYQYVRLFYTHSTQAGTLNANFVSKGV